MKINVDVLNEMYKIVTMGIIGIDEVKEKIENNVLEKNILDCKKKYQTYKLDIAKMLNEYNEEPQEINAFVKMFNEMYTDIKLINNDDSKIVKMMIEGTNKGIIKLQEIKNNKEIKDKNIEKLAYELLELLEFQVNAWKVYL